MPLCFMSDRSVLFSIVISRFGKRAGLHSSIACITYCLFCLPPDVGNWLRLVFVALPGLFILLS